MSLVMSWLVYPAVMVALCLGCGLLVDLVARRTVPGVLLVPLGVATVIVLAQFTTWQEATAVLTTPLVVVAAIAGLVLGRARVRRPRTWAPYAAAAGVFAVYAAPIVLSGDVTWAGFVRLDDTATWFAFTDRLMEDGYGFDGLDPSTYREVLRANFAIGYPGGAFLAYGAARPLVGQDLAWIFQPHMAFLGAALALVLWQLTDRLRLGPWLRAVVAFVAPLAAVLYGYVMWGGLKEILGALLLALLPALLPPLWSGRPAVRGVVPLTVAAAAFFAVFGPSSGAWLAPLGLVAAAPALWRAGRRGLGATAVRLGAGGVLALLLALPTVIISWRFRIVGGGLTDGGAPNEDIGNLFGPLDLLQILGIWPSPDFRAAPETMGATNAMLTVVAMTAVVGIVLAIRRGAGTLLAFLAFTAVGSGAALRVGGAWIDGKTMAMTAPLLVALALAGALGLTRLGGAWWRSVPGVLGALAAVVITAGVLWSAALTYDGVALAPSDRMQELADIGQRFEGGGPGLLTEYVPHAARHFLRTIDAEGATELRWRGVRMVNGELPPDKVSMEIDDFALGEILIYRTLVLRKMPSSSRPPSAYRLAFSGEYYDVWTREQEGRIVEHVPFGEGHDAASVPACGELRRLGRVAEREGGRVVAAVRPTSIVVPLNAERLRPSWPPLDAEAVLPNEPDTALLDVPVPAGGAYNVWLGGSFGRGVEVSVDGTPIGRLRDERQHAGQFLPAGSAELSAGRRLVGIEYPSDGLRPGDGDTALEVGPLVLTPDRPRPALRAVEPQQVTDLCRTGLDWAEVVVP